METFAVELTSEELAIILKKREDEAKQVVAEELFEKIKEGIKALEELGYRMHLPHIGGKYVPLHSPTVYANLIRLYKW